MKAVLRWVGLAVIALVQVTGLGDVIEDAGDFDSPDGLEAGGFGEALTSLLGLGRVPLMIWLASLLLGFGAIGLIGQVWIANLFGAPLSAGWAALAAGGVTLAGLVFTPLFYVLLQRRGSGLRFVSTNVA